MSLASVKTYARARMVALGYTEWSDGFNYHNIPAQRLGDVFHVEFGTASGSAQHHDCQEIEVPFTVRLFEPTGKDPKTLIDRAVAATDAVLAEMLAATNRLTQSGIKNVRFDTMTIEPLDDSNDNGVIAKISFSALVIVSTR